MSGALCHGAYSWETECIHDPGKWVPKVIPKPDPSDGPSLSAGQTAATSAISAALQRLHDPETARLLQAVPAGAWGAGKEFADDVELIIVAIRNGVPDAVAELQDLARYGYAKGDPWKLEEYCAQLSKEWAKFGRTLIPETPEPEVEAEAPIFGYQIKVGETTITVTGAPPAPTALPEPEVKAEPEPEPKPKARTLPGFTDFTDVWNLADLEVPHLFREGSFPLEELSLIASEPGTGKTTLSIGLGLSVALGRGLLAGFTPHRAGKVAMYLSEDGAIPTAKRLRAWCELTGVSRVELERAILDGRLSFCCGESAALLDYSTGVCRRTAAHRELLEACGRENYDLVVVDSLIEWAGVPNENDNAQMQQGAKALIELARASGGSVLSLHHSNKASDKTNAVGLQAIRGGTALAGKVRWAALLSHVHPEDVARYAIPEEDRFRHLRLDVVKTQYAERPGLPVYLERRAGGALEAVKLVAPKSKDVLLSLAHALAKALGDNPERLTKWDVIQKKPGVEFRAKLKWSQPDATVRNIGLAYDLAVAEGLISEEHGEETEHGQAPIIPRQTQQEVDEDAY